MGWNGSYSEAGRLSVKKNNAKGNSRSSKSLIWGAVGSFSVIVLLLLVMHSQFKNAAHPNKVPSIRKDRLASKETISKKLDKQVDPIEVPQSDSKDNPLRERLKQLSPDERRELAYEIIKDKKINLEPTTNHPFRTGIELSMARIFMTRVGDPPPPIHTTFIPIQDEAHLAEILIANNPGLEGDSDQVREAKATVEFVKKEMMQFIKGGGSPSEFMSYYYDKLNSAFEERRASMREVVRIAQEEPEIAQEYYEQTEKNLSEKGIRGLEFSLKQKERLGLE